MSAQAGDDALAKQPQDSVADNNQTPLPESKSLHPPEMQHIHRKLQLPSPAAVPEVIPRTTIPCLARRNVADPNSDQYQARTSKYGGASAASPKSALQHQGAVGARGVLGPFSTSRPKSAAAGAERPGRPPRPSSAARAGALTCARPSHRPE